MAVVSECVLPNIGALPQHIGNEDEIPVQQPVVEHRLERGDAVRRGFALGEMVAAKRRGQVASDVRSRGISAGSDGHHHRTILGTDDCTTTTLCRRNDSDHGPRLCSLRLVPRIEPDWRVLCYSGEKRDALSGDRVAAGATRHEGPTRRTYSTRLA